MISKSKRLEIANVCYANVAGTFASLQNPKNQGEYFSWDQFPAMCERMSDMWVFTHGIKGDQKEVQLLAKEFCREIAETLVHHMRR